MKNFILGILFTLVVLVGGGAYFAMRGYIDTRADSEPSPLESKFAMSAMDASADRNAPETKNPVAPTDDNLVAGAKLYAASCAGCHGYPAEVPAPAPLAFYPPAPQFFKDAPDMPDHENFYVIQHGVRWTGMPAWRAALTDQQIWQVVAFLSSIDKLPPAARKELVPAFAAVPVAGGSSAPAAAPAPAEKPRK